MTPVLLSVNVGRPRDVSWQGRTVYTGVWKHPVDGPAMVRRLNIDGDGQGDTSGHGGEQRAVLVYQIQSYRHWQQHFGRDDLGYGQFGENLTVEPADACDVPTRWSCRSGVCHTCVTPLLSGEVAYSPAPLEPPAGGEVLICCAQPATDVVLDM